MPATKKSLAGRLTGRTDCAEHSLYCTRVPRVARAASSAPKEGPSALQSSDMPITYLGETQCTIPSGRKLLDHQTSVKRYGGPSLLSP